MKHIKMLVFLIMKVTHAENKNSGNLEGIQKKYSPKIYSTLPLRNSIFMKNLSLSSMHIDTHKKKDHAIYAGYIHIVH